MQVSASAIGGIAASLTQGRSAQSAAGSHSGLMLLASAEAGDPQSAGIRLRFVRFEKRARAQNRLHLTLEIIET